MQQTTYTLILHKIYAKPIDIQKVKLNLNLKVKPYFVSFNLATHVYVIKLHISQIIYK